MQLASNFDFSRFIESVSEDQPSGPDLELAGDGDFFEHSQVDARLRELRARQMEEAKQKLPM